MHESTQTPPCSPTALQGLPPRHRLSPWGYTTGPGPYPSVPVVKMCTPNMLTPCTGSVGISNTQTPHIYHLYMHTPPTHTHTTLTHAQPTYTHTPHLHTHHHFHTPHLHTHKINLKSGHDPLLMSLHSTTTTVFSERKSNSDIKKINSTVLLMKHIHQFGKPSDPLVPLSF